MPKSEWECFERAAELVIREMLRLFPNPVVLRIGLKGGRSGSVLFTMPEWTALNIISRLTGKPGTMRLEPIGKSALGEFAGIIAGNALSLLPGQESPAFLTPAEWLDPGVAGESASGREGTGLRLVMGAVGPMEIRILMD